MSEDKKIKVLTISDHPFSPSGVGTQTKYVCEGLLKSGKFKIVSLGGAIKHEKYDTTKTEAQRKQHPSNAEALKIAGDEY